MRIARRLFYWLFLVGGITGIGMVVFAVVRSQPRCTILTSDYVEAVAADGSRLLTRLTHPASGGAWRVWDAHSGEQLHEWVHPLDNWTVAYSGDGRHVATRFENGKMRLFNWQEGEMHEFEAPNDLHNHDGLTFSKKGRWLIVASNFVMEVATRQIATPLKQGPAIVSDDESLLFFRDGPDNAVTVWDLDQKRPRGVLPVPPGSKLVSSNGKLLIENRQEPLTKLTSPFVGKRVGSRIEVWDTVTLKHRFHWQLQKAGDVQTALSPKGDRLAVWINAEKGETSFDLIDASTGKSLRTFPMRLCGQCSFSADGSLVLICRGTPYIDGRATMLDAATGETLWDRSGMGQSWFAKNTGLVVHYDYPEPFAILDARTGAVQSNGPSDFDDYYYQPDFTLDGRFFISHGKRQRTGPPRFWETWLETHFPNWWKKDEAGALVIETATGREMFRRFDGFTLISDDGDTLVTAETTNPGDWDTERIIRVWDLHPTKACFWAIGAALATALTWQLVLLRLMRVCWKRQTS